MQREYMYIYVIYNTYVIADDALSKLLSRQIANWPQKLELKSISAIFASSSAS